MSLVSDRETKQCVKSEPHETHDWTMGGIDGNFYVCPGVADSSGWHRPDHYGGEENPFEPIKVIEHYGLNFNLGNAVKYILRTGKKKGEPNLKELRKAYTYIGFEIRHRERMGEE